MMVFMQTNKDAAAFTSNVKTKDSLATLNVTKVSYLIRLLATVCFPIWPHRHVVRTNSFQLADTGKMASMLTNIAAVHIILSVETLNSRNTIDVILVRLMPNNNNVSFRSR